MIKEADSISNFQLPNPNKLPIKQFPIGHWSLRIYLTLKIGNWEFLRDALLMKRPYAEFP